MPTEVAGGYRADLEAMGALCRDRALRCLFMTQPHAYGPPPAQPALVSRFWMVPPYADYGLELDSMSQIARIYNVHLADFARRAGHGLCDLAAGMPPQQVLFYDDMHFTDEGAARVAELAAGCVRQMLGAGKDR